MPVGGLLIGMSGGENGHLVEGPADDLESGRDAVWCHAARQGQRRMTAQVERRGVAQARRHAVEIAPRLLDCLERPCRRPHHRHQQNVDRRHQRVERTGQRRTAELQPGEIDGGHTATEVEQPGQDRAVFLRARRIGRLVGDRGFDTAERHPVVARLVERLRQFHIDKRGAGLLQGRGRAIEGTLPPISILDPAEKKKVNYSPESLAGVGHLLEIKLKEFGVEVSVDSIHPGPVITRYEIQPAAGVKVSRISNLAKDLARSLAVTSVRVVEVIPGKTTVGIEIPNEDRQIVRFSEVLSTPEFDNFKSPVTLALGHDIGGKPIITDLAKMPHLWVVKKSCYLACFKCCLTFLRKRVGINFVPSIVA